MGCTPWYHVVVFLSVAHSAGASEGGPLTPAKRVSLKSWIIPPKTLLLLTFKSRTSKWGWGESGKQQGAAHVLVFKCDLLDVWLSQRFWNGKVPNIRPFLCSVVGCNDCVVSNVNYSSMIQLFSQLLNHGLHSDQGCRVTGHLSLSQGGKRLWHDCEEQSISLALTISPLILTSSLLQSLSPLTTSVGGIKNSFEALHFYIRTERTDAHVHFQ